MRLDDKRSRHFEKFGTEESQTVETFERKVHGTPEIEPQHHYSYNTYTERRTYGRDENGDVVVKIEKDPKDPVRPATPVRPVTPVGDIPQEHYFKAIEPFDTLPLTIPRIDIRKTDGSKASNSPHSFSSYNEQISPRSGVSFEQRSTRSPRSAPISPRHVTNTSGIPMKKVTRKSRWVSIHDGRPMSPFVETVTYEPKYPIMERNYDERTHLNPESIVKNKQVSYYDDDRYLQRPHYSNNGRYIDECAYIVENPLYRD